MNIFKSCFLLNLLLLEVRSIYYCRKLLKEQLIYETLRDVNTKWFRQKLFVANKEVPQYWNQRYFVRSSLWKNKETAPVFLMLPGEYEASTLMMIGGFWKELGKEFGALLFALEHRFYGQSHPTQDASLENLKYLSIHHAHNDIAYFIRSMKQEYNLTSENKWVLFGGGYGGSIAAWFAAKKPQIIFGGLISSAPIKAEMNFFGYQEKVSQILDVEDKNCSVNLRNAVKQIRAKLLTSSGTKTIVEKFNVCKSGFKGTNPKDEALFFQKSFEQINKAVEYDTDTHFIEEISYVCNYMSKNSIPEPLDRLAALIKYYKHIIKINKYGPVGCLEGNYQNEVDSYKATGWNDTYVKNGKRQWLYQNCNELGFFQTSSSAKSILHDVLPLQYFIDLCMDVFGKEFNEEEIKKKIDNTNTKYKGFNIKTRNVIFIRNDLDPWFPLVLNKRSSQSSPLIDIEDGNHCIDMKPFQGHDGNYVNAARNRTIDIMRSWKLNN